MTKVILQNFSGGIVNDPRNTGTGVARVVSNFDIYTSPNRLIPFRDSETGDSGASTSKKQNFCIGLYLPGSTNLWRLFALGVKSGAATAEVLMKDISTGGTNDLGDSGWLTPSAHQSTAGTTNFNLFVYYKRTGLIYGAKAGTTVWAFNPTTGGSWDDDIITTNGGTPFTYTNIAQGLVFSKDDILYIPYDNKIAKNDNGVWTNAALTIPSQYVINSICEFNNYIAVAASPLSGVGNSRVFIWDRSTTITTVTENIDWGYGALKILETVSGFLIGISLDSTGRLNDRLIFRYYQGAGADSFTEILGLTGSSLPIAKQKINNRIYFMSKISLNGSVREGVFSFGKSNNGWNLTHERTSENDTVLGGGALRNFIYVGDFLFTSYTSNAGTDSLSKTNDTASYTHTSIFETVINPEMREEDKNKLKQMKSVSIGYKTQSAAAGQVVVKAKVDGGSNVTIITATTTGVNVIEMPMGNIALNTGREFEFRIESTLGADVFSVEYDYDVINTLA